MPCAGTIAVPHRDDDDEDGTDTWKGVNVSGSSLAGYAVQLVLSGIEAKLKEHAETLATASKTPTGRKSRLLRVLRPELAVKAAQEAPDSAVRNAALSLVSILASEMPEAVLKHVLEVRVKARTEAEKLYSHSLREAHWWLCLPSGQ